MRRVAVLSHRDVAHELGHLGTWLDDRGDEVIRVFREDDPTLPSGDLLVALGSPDSVALGHCRTPAEREIAFVEAWLASGRPYVGICFGAQTLARATGGAVHRMPATYRAYTALDHDVLDHDVNQSVASCLGGRWAVWHEDAIVAPDAAVRAAHLPHADAVFRVGRAWGLQPHVEFTSAIVERLARTVSVPETDWRGLWEGLRDDEEGHRTRAWSLFDAIVSDLDA